ncbi:unnamed protein product, partial [Timema podura]|nr:unnamed protein product [Timema podura]
MYEETVLPHYMIAPGYQMPMISSSSHTSVSSAPVEYDPMSYAPPTTHTIFRPASKKMGASLFDELDSFYLDLANLESVGAIPPSTDIEEQSEGNRASSELVMGRIEFQMSKYDKLASSKKPFSSKRQRMT